MRAGMFNGSSRRATSGHQILPAASRADKTQKFNPIGGLCTIGSCCGSQSAHHAHQLLSSSGRRPSLGFQTPVVTISRPDRSKYVLFADRLFDSSARRRSKPLATECASVMITKSLSLLWWYIFCRWRIRASFLAFLSSSNFSRTASPCFCRFSSVLRGDKQKPPLMDLLFASHDEDIFE
jgi:hypothetical protein